MEDMGPDPSLAEARNLHGGASSNGCGCFVYLVSKVAARGYAEEDGEGERKFGGFSERGMSRVVDENEELRCNLQRKEKDLARLNRYS